MEDGNFRFYGFGEFKVDSRRRILLKNDQAVPLSPRNFDLLLFLIKNEGRILSHDDILETVWEGTFVEQANLKNAISVLRRVLGEAPNEAFFIRTIPRRGYSFVAPVTPFDENRSEEFSDPLMSGEFVRPKQNSGSFHYSQEPHVPAADPSVHEKFDAVDDSTPKRRLLTLRNLVFAGILLVGAAVAGIAAKSYFWGVKPIKYSVENVNIIKITSDGNLVGGGASISPNGNYLVYVVRNGENSSLWTRQIVTGVSRQISPELVGSIWASALTPDEDFVYYVYNNPVDETKSGLFKISTFGGVETRISNLKGGAISISPDGQQLAAVESEFGKPTRILTMTKEGGDQKEIWIDEKDIRIWDMKYSLDGRAVVIAIRRQLPDKTVYSVEEIPIAGGPVKTLIKEQDKQIANIASMPDGQSMLVTIRESNAELRQVWQYFFAGGEFKRVTNDNASYRGLALTRDGRTLVTSQESRLSTLWGSKTGSVNDLTQVKSGTHYLIDLGWTADARIVYSTVSNTAERVAIISEDGSGEKDLTAGKDGIWLFPGVSRDGRDVTYSSSHGGLHQLWAVDYEGKNHRLIVDADEDIYNGRLLSDGETAIYLLGFTKRLMIRKKGEEPRALIAKGSATGNWAISPDETMVASEYKLPNQAKYEVRVINIETGEVIKSFNFSTGRQLRWTPDGKSLATDKIEGEGGRIWIHPIDGSPASSLIAFKSEEIFSFNWSFDGRKFALIRGKHLTDAVKINVGVDH